ncbi:ATP-binding cassette domain-containing protein [Xylophilus rhododendri]|uniref:ATP-binding cassette domain-containing protein n=1 Tax=Xylophilus rhododendri TaxID=2697032 RepID=A0A857J5L2_9BURK|nr:amino acid ABC transporter ATP-binding protein [Xylophilus rhododendri]QHI98379.1 ATP-binding cassette domain-containing protein [Xylophilus rhododendri]
MAAETWLAGEAARAAAPEAAPAKTVVELVKVRKSYGQTEVLKGIDLRVRQGECVFLIGPSGSGKSTLLRCCNRLEELSSGDVLVDGVNIYSPHVDVNRLRTQMGMVFQSFNLYPHMSALGNVTLALRHVLGKGREEADAIGHAMLKRVGLSDRAGHFPSQLSGGQQQRVGIARTLALQPKVVLFDEPTSALDPELVNGVLQTMRELRDSGMTMMVVSHEMRFAREAADTVVFMADGAIVEQGTAQQVFGQPQHARTREFLSQVER